MPLAGPTIEFDMMGLEEVRARFARHREYVYGAMLTAFRRIGHVLVPALKEETPVGATGNLRNKTVFQIMGKTEDMRLEIRQSAFSSDGYPYGQAVRGGTRPHFPPYRALIPWVMKKLGIFPEKQAARVAFLVARKISRVGTPANPYHVKVLDSHLPDIQAIALEELDNMAARLAGK